MSDVISHQGRPVSIGRQFLVGQTFGVVFGVVLYLLEPWWLYRGAHGDFGVSLSTVFALYAVFGWLAGAAVGVLSGLVGSVFKRLVRDDGTFPWVGPFLGFLFMMLFILRMESGRSLKTMPGNILVSLVAAALVWVGIGYLGRRFLARYVPPPRRPVALKALALAAVLTVLIPGFASRMQSKGVPTRTPTVADAPNVVLIVVDALRADHLSFYGYDRDTSPNLDRFAENAMVFRNAYSHGNRTAFAMPSLFTSLYPSYHGLVGFQQVMIPLPQDRTTIAEVCRDAGYTTVGVMSNLYLKTPFGMTKGFDVVEEFELSRYWLSVYRALTNLGLIVKPTYPELNPEATAVTDYGLNWLARVKDRPFFLFLHYMDVHHPYDPPAEYEQMFNSNGSEIDPDWLFMKTVAMLKVPPPLKLPREELQRLIDLYDACIRYTDEEIGRVLDELASLDLDRETVVIFTADHGDEFLEAGTLYHNNLLIESLIRVPLVIGRIPPAGDRGRPGDVRTMVRHVDVLPTIAELVGGQRPMGVQGHSLVPLVEGGSEPVAEYSIAEGDYCKSINAGRWKMVYVDSSDAYHLYDLSTDALGVVDVSDRYPDRAADMRAVMDEYLSRVAELQKGESIEMSDDAIKKLKALGYIQ